MTTVKKKDFIQISYTGKLEDGTVFDTTDKAVAQLNHVFNAGMKYGDLIICVGEGQVLEGFDSDLVGKEVGKKYSVMISADKAFGKKDSKKLKLMPVSAFKKQGLNIQPGMQLNVDGHIALVKTVTGGRTVVDFNHPLSGRDVNYDYNIVKIISDDSEKIKAYLQMQLHMTDIDVKAIDGKVVAVLPVKLPSEMERVFSDKIKELVPIKEIKFDHKSEKINDNNESKKIDNSKQKT